MDNADQKHEDGRKYDVGDKIGDLIVTGVSVEEKFNPETGEYEKVNFIYHTETPEQIAAREAQRKADEEALKATEQRNAEFVPAVPVDAVPKHGEPESPTPHVAEDTQSGEEVPADQ